MSICVVLFWEFGKFKVINLFLVHVTQLVHRNTDWIHHHLSISTAVISVLFGISISTEAFKFYKFFSCLCCQLASYKFLKLSGSEHLLLAASKVYHLSLWATLFPAIGPEVVGRLPEFTGFVPFPIAVPQVGLALFSALEGLVRSMAFVEIIFSGITDQVFCSDFNWFWRGRPSFQISSFLPSFSWIHVEPNQRILRVASRGEQLF